MSSRSEKLIASSEGLRERGVELERVSGVGVGMGVGVGEWEQSVSCVSL